MRRDTFSDQVWRSHRWRQLSKQVLERDGHVCQLCGDRATTTDHVVPIRLDPSRAYDPSNCRALCNPCNLRARHGTTTPRYPARRAW